MLTAMRRYYWIGRALGWDNLPRRVWQETKLRFGVLRRRLPGGPAPAGALRAAFVPGYDADAAMKHWRERAALLGLGAARLESLRTALRGCVDDATWDRTVGAEVRDLARGRMRMFSDQSVTVGTPPEFNRDPIHNVAWPIGRHWTEYSASALGMPDVKCIWEASRFSWAYAIARHSVRTGSEDAGGLFWSLLHHWITQNPYGLTPQWNCGQESSFRCFAAVFAACATLNSSMASPAALHRLTELVWYTGRHVRENINYARSQKNNHAISEAVCLVMIGRLFPELRAAATWAAAGERILESEVARQIYSDGSFVQHSVNYHRVLLDDLCWAASVLRATGGALSKEATAQFGRASAWLSAFTDPQTGDAPNYGPNDGALVLPLSCCGYRDYRPAVQAASVLSGRGRVYGGGPWDEALLWLGGQDEPAQRARAGALPLAVATPEFPDGGYYCFRGPHSHGFVRCHSFRDRPTQADMLHFDLTYRGVNVLRDGGSYSYHAKPPWKDWFHGTASHNTVVVDNEHQMEKGPRFLWLRWTQSRVRVWEESADRTSELFRGEHYGYRRLTNPVTHERRIGRLDDSFVIVDELHGRGIHELTLRWRLYPGTWRAVEPTLGMAAVWETEIEGERYRIWVGSISQAQVRMAQGEVSPPEGWESRHYNERTPVPTIVASVRGELPASFATICGPADADWADVMARLDSDPKLPPLRAAATLRSFMESSGERRLVGD